MLGIGHRLEREVKHKILADRAKSYTHKYDELISQRLHPSEAVEIIRHEEFQNRHPKHSEKSSIKMNNLAGTISQGYFEDHRLPENSRQMSKRNSEEIEELQKAKNDFEKMKNILKRDHVKENSEIEFGEKLCSEYHRHFIEDGKMKREVKRDKRHHQMKNDLKEYAEAYLKSNQCLRQ